MPTLGGQGQRAEMWRDELRLDLFWVEVGSVLVAAFTGCSGLSGEIAVETFREGGLNDYEHKLPGPASYGNITLTGGLAATHELWKWFNDVASGKIERHNVSIVMFAQDRTEALRWNLEGAFPVRWEGPTFSADDENLAIHTVELAHKSISVGT